MLTSEVWWFYSVRCQGTNSLCVITKSKLWPLSAGVSLYDWNVVSFMKLVLTTLIWCWGGQERARWLPWQAYTVFSFEPPAESIAIKYHPTTSSSIFGRSTLSQAWNHLDINSCHHITSTNILHISFFAMALNIILWPVLLIYNYRFVQLVQAADKNNEHYHNIKLCLTCYDIDSSLKQKQEKNGDSPTPAPPSSPPSHVSLTLLPFLRISPSSPWYHL